MNKSTSAARMLKRLIFEYLRGIDSVIRLLAMFIAFSAITGGLGLLAYGLDLLVFGGSDRIHAIELSLFLLLLPLTARLTIAAGDLTNQAMGKRDKGKQKRGPVPLKS